MFLSEAVDHTSRQHPGWATAIATSTSPRAAMPQPVAMSGRLAKRSRGADGDLGQRRRTLRRALDRTDHRRRAPSTAVR